MQASVAKPVHKAPIAANIPAKPGTDVAAATTGTATKATDPHAPATTATTATAIRPGAVPVPAPPVVATTKSEPSEAVHSMESSHSVAAKPPVYVREKEGRVIYNGKGFRVQIYSGPDREKAIYTKTEFMRHFPGIRTYITYTSPSFRVRVGNYRSRSDAAGMLREANSMYSPCVIVPDMITINSL